MATVRSGGIACFGVIKGKDGVPCGRVRERSVNFMNDRYLYRAKRTDNGEWAEGFLARYDERFEVANIVCNEILIPVISSTICQ